MSSISIPTSSATGTSPPSSSETSTPSVASRTPNLGAIIGGSVGGVVVLLWILVLLWYAHRHSCFRRPGYTRQRDERREGGLFGFGKRSGSPAITPTTESAIAAPRPVTGFGARTFGEIRPSVYGGEAPRQSAYDPVTPRTTFNQPPPPPPKSNPRPRSSFGDRPRSGFGAERERPRSAFGSRSPSRRGFFGSGVRDTEWAGAPRRINVEPNASDEEGRTGVLGWFARVREHAAQRKRVRAEYEEDMKRMRGRAAVENDYSRY